MLSRTVIIGMCLVSALMSGVVRAQQDVEIPCADSPAEAVLALPEPLSTWGRIRCSMYGHVLTAADGWIWSFPGAFAPVRLPAQMVRRAPSEVGHAAHFTHLDWAELDTARATWVDAQINSTMGSTSSGPVTGYALTLKNQQGRSHIVYFVISQDGGAESIWGLLCDGPECREKAAFMLLPPKPVAE